MLALLSSHSVGKDEHQELNLKSQTESKSWPSATISRVTLDTMNTASHRTALEGNYSSDIFDHYIRKDPQREARLGYPPQQPSGHRSRLVHLLLRARLTSYADAVAAR